MCDCIPKTLKKTNPKQWKFKELAQTTEFYEELMNKLNIPCSWIGKLSIVKRTKIPYINLQIE